MSKQEEVIQVLTLASKYLGMHSKLSIVDFKNVCKTTRKYISQAIGLLNENETTEKETTEKEKA